MRFKYPYMKKLLRFLPILFLLFSFACKKAIQEKQQDILVDAITSGVWKVEKYMEGQTDITADFSGYEFKFSKDWTVTATLGSATTNGTWTGDINTKTISSEFPSAGDPLKKLNGLWKIKDSYWDYVKAEMVVGSSTNLLQLRKKP
jgi:hypothetical protein